MTVINTMRFIVLLFAGIILLSACDVFSSGDSEIIYGDWDEVASFEGIPRGNAVSFSINGRGYVGTGYDGDDRLNDFWEYDLERNFWIQKADFPGTPRSAAVGFATADRGYIGTGYNPDEEVEYLKDFWEYDPENNSWNQVADFGGSARYGAVAFAIGDTGYVGTGNDDNYLKDFWQYDPSTDQWSQIVSLPGDKRIDAAAFSINGKGYVGTGRNNGIYEEDFWEYDPASGLWTELQDLDEDRDENERAIPRTNAVGFEINGKGYFALGENSGSLATIWQYDPATDTWNDDLGIFEGTIRRDAVAFTIDSVVYIGTGTDGTLRFDDFWLFNPTIEQIDE